MSWKVDQGLSIGDSGFLVIGQLGVPVAEISDGLK
jgi:hypothetical protein